MRATAARKSPGRSSGSREPLKREVRVDARGHGPGFHRGAVREDDAAGRAAGRGDAPHLRLAADVDAEPRAHRLERVGQPAHPALDVAPDAARAARAAHRMVQQDVGGAGRGGRGERSDDGVGGQRRPQGLGFEPALEDGPGGAGQQLERRGQVGPEPAELPVEPPQTSGVAQAPGRAAPPPRRRGGERVRRGSRDDGLEHARDAVEQGAVPRERLGVAAAELRDLAPVARGVPTQQQVAPVEQGRERRRIARQDRQSVLPEPQVADDFRQQQADDVGRRWTPCTRATAPRWRRSRRAPAGARGRRPTGRPAPGTRRRSGRCARRR